MGGEESPVRPHGLRYRKVHRRKALDRFQTPRRTPPPFRIHRSSIDPNRLRPIAGLSLLLRKVSPPQRARPEDRVCQSFAIDFATLSSPSLSLFRNPPKDWDPFVKQTYSAWVNTENGNRKWHLSERRFSFFPSVHSVAYRSRSGVLHPANGGPPGNH